MKAQVDAEALADASRTAASIARGEITGCLLIEAVGDHLLITGGDGDTYIEVKIRANVIRSGVVATPAKVFAKATPKLTGDVLLTEDDEGRLLVESLVSVLTLPTIDASQYPQIRWPDTEPVDVSECWDRLRNITYAASLVMEPRFKAVKLLPDGWAEAYDKTRMARTRIPDGLSAAVRRDSIEFAAKVIEDSVSVSTGPNGVAFYGEGVRIHAAVVAGEVESAAVPQVEEWLAAGSTFSCKRKDFLEAIGLIEVVRGDTIHPFRLDVNDGQANIRASSVDIGSVSSDFPVDGDLPWPIGMTTHFVKDVLARCDADEVTFQFGSAQNHPIVVESDGITHLFGPNRAYKD